MINSNRIDSKTHFTVTASEPYAICCIEGIKISKGMHNFGEKRFGEGFKDDYRSVSTSNTRIVGDFRKSIRLSSIVHTMESKLSGDPVWKYHFDQLAGSLHDKIPAVHGHLQAQMKLLVSLPFKRKRLQTRFFELGNTCKFSF